jgi:hypothetical protein
MEVPVGNRPIGGHLGIKKPPKRVVTLIRLTTNYRYFADPIAAPGYSPSLASLPARD